MAELTAAGRRYALRAAHESIVARVALTRGEPRTEGEEPWPSEYVEAAIRICNEVAEDRMPGHITITLPRPRQP